MTNTPNTSGAGALLGYECRRVTRSPIVWAVLALLSGAGFWGARNTAQLHQEQAADLLRMADAESHWYQDIRTRAARYAQPSSRSLPYWQDPTDAAGFSRYFLRRHASKPHLPLSILSVGQSDLQPFAVPIRLETLFGGDPVYDFEHPRALATGSFDLGFVLTFVLPLCLGAVAAAIGAHERDQGILALISAQPLSARRWWLARLGALVAVLVPGVVVCIVVSLAAAGAPVATAWLDTLAATALVAAHVLFWLAVAGVCLVRGLGTVSTAASVAGIWLVLTLGLPLGGSLALRFIAPSLSPISDVDDLRRTTDVVQAESGVVISRRLAARFGTEWRTVNPTALDYSTRLILITEEMEQRLSGAHGRRREHRGAAIRLGRALWWLSPQIAFQTALADLAGTGTARHELFLDAVRTFQLDLRAFMYPRVLEQVRFPSRRPCESCPGRLNFTAYDAIPRFSMPEPSSSSRAASGFGSAAWLALLAALMLVVGPGTTGTWKIGSD